MAELTTQQRLDATRKPDGWPIMYQSWDKLIFLNWKVSVESLRHLIPEPLEIDTFDGSAWLTVTPLRLYNVRPVAMPPLPYISHFLELNVRTYVHYDGVPGVWFFSLDADSSLAVWGARTFFSLPYFNAKLESTGDRDITFNSERVDADATFSASWTIGEALPLAQPGTLDFFLAERYCLYSASEDSIYRCRIAHEPWPRQQPLNVKYPELKCISADGLPIPTTEPFLFCAGPVTVGVWPLERVR